MCSPCVEYAEPAAIVEPIAPASEMPSWRSCPCGDSL